MSEDLQEAVRDMTPRERTAYVARRLAEIGIETREKEDAQGFLDAVYIENGVILYRPEATASNILHEAGHLACIPAQFRSKATGDLDNIAREMCDYVGRHLEGGGDAEDPIVRAIMQCSDPEATAWAWAFGVHIGLEPERIIEDEDYQGDGPEVRLMVSVGMYVGINGLRAAGMVSNPKEWPVMSKWLQDAEGEDR